MYNIILFQSYSDFLITPNFWYWPSNVEIVQNNSNPDIQINFVKNIYLGVETVFR